MCAGVVKQSSCQGSYLGLLVAGKVVAAVCHGPAGLVDATGPDGKSLFNGKRVTGFCNTEEEAVGKTHQVPFLLEDRMKALGGKYEKKGDWADFSIADGRLVTGDPGLIVEGAYSAINACNICCVCLVTCEIGSCACFSVSTFILSICYSAPVHDPSAHCVPYLSLALIEEYSWCWTFHAWVPYDSWACCRSESSIIS